MKSLPFSIAGVCGILLVGGCAGSGSRQKAEPAFAELTPSAPEPGPAVAATPTLVVTNQPEPELLRPTGNLFTLGPGDRLDIEMLGDATSRATTFVGPDGKLYFPVMGANVLVLAMRCFSRATFSRSRFRASW